MLGVKDYRNATMRKLLKWLGSCGYLSASISDERFEKFILAIEAAVEKMKHPAEKD